MSEQTDMLIASIKRQAEELTRRHLLLIEKNNLLNQQQIELQQKIENQETVIEKLNNQLRLLKITKFADKENETERLELKKTINEYIKEIDNCIKLLNR